MRRVIGLKFNTGHLLILEYCLYIGGLLAGEMDIMTPNVLHI